MWVSENFNQYEVIDVGCGEKVERWGKYILTRPDPLAFFNHDISSDKKKSNAIYHRSRSGGGSWEFIDLPEVWSISYSLGNIATLNFNLKPFSFKHTGLFPEQSANWDWFSEIISNSLKSGEKKEFSVLNLFAYTGGATLAALSSGASVVHVDSSKGMVTWAKENASLSKLSDKPVRWIVDDAIKFVEREIRRGHRYDGIIMDPPSYGRGPDGEVWKLEENVYDLICSASKLLDENSKFFLLNSYTTGLSKSTLEYMVSLSIGKKLGGKVVADELGFKVKNTGLLFPQGASARWTLDK